MSIFIQIPNMIQKLKGNSKLEDIYSYALIRSQIKDNTYTACITEAELAQRGGWGEKTSYNHIKRLIAACLISIYEMRENSSRDHRYNVYKLDYLEQDYSIYNPNFIDDPSLSSKQKGLLMLLKSHCFPGTNHLEYKSTQALSKILGMDRKPLGRMIKELERMHQVRIIDKTLILLNQNILLSQKKDDRDNWTYETIYKFCLEKNTVPPMRETRKNTWMINWAELTPEQLDKDLHERFHTLPRSVTLAYFAEGLTNNHYTKKEEPKHEFIL